MATLPSTSLTGAAIRDNINSFGGSADNAWLTFFQANDVNKWSKWKPVKYAAAFTTGSEDPPFWKAHDGLCGFTSGSILFSDEDSMITACDNGTTFVYDPPTGGSTYPYRGGDWRNYNSSAKAPFWDVYATGSFIQGDTSSSIDIELVDNSSDIDSSTNLVLGDILPGGTNVANWYFGVLIVQGSNRFKKSSTTSIGASASIPEAARKFTITYSELGFVPSSYKIYPCLFQYAHGASGKVMPLPLQMHGGNAMPGISGSVVVKKPGVTFASTPSFYSGAKLTFRFTVVYATSYEVDGATFGVTINKVSSSGTVSQIHSSTQTPKHTGTSGTSAYTMDLTIQLNASYETGYTYQVTVTDYSTPQTMTANYLGTTPP